MSIRKTFYIIALLTIIIPSLVSADGMIMPPDDYWVQETAQKAVIFYEGGVETMVVSMTFQGNATEFGWVIPVPAKPTITKGSDELFTSLEELTAIYYGYDDGDYLNEMPISGSADEKRVTVIETQQIEYYDVTTLSATDKDALATWLDENGYNYPESESYILNSYIENGWYFIAMKIDTKSLQSDNVASQLKNGHAVPVVISFETENIVYPLKISSVTSDRYMNNGINYSGGVVNDGILLKNQDKLTISADDAINNLSGTLETWIKPDWSEGDSKTANIVTVRSGDTNSLLFRFDIDSNITSDGYHYTLSTYNDADYMTNTWTSESFGLDLNDWQQVALTWQEGQVPSFYLNGAKIPLTESSTALFNVSTFSNDSMYVGSGEYDSRSIDSVVDEYVIYNTVHTVDMINDNYNKMKAGEEIIVDNNTKFLAHFDSSLLDAVSGNYLAYTGEIIYDQYYNESALITLYVIDDHKKMLADFNTDYAGWIKKTEIENLALNDQGNPWIVPSNDKYFLTKLSRSMAYDQMTDDLYPKNADDNNPVNSPGTENENGKIVFYIVVGIGMVLTLVILFVLNRQSKFKN